MKRELIFRVEEEIRIGEYLRTRAGFTAKQVSRAKFREGGFRVNGMQERSTFLLHPGDLLTVCLEEEGDGSHHLESGNTGEPEILYEDEDLLVVRKPAGLVCHPAGGHYGDTLANMIVGYYRSRGQSLTVRPVGRLDREVSGLMLFARNQMAAARLSAQREEGIFEKIYYAEVEGVIREDRIRVTSSIEQQGASRPADTELEVLERRADTTLLKIRIHTGRTHQIRIHCQRLGHPILGDVEHGAGKTAGDGIHLHAGELRFRHPFREERMEFRLDYRKEWKV